MKIGIYLFGIALTLITQLKCTLKIRKYISIPLIFIIIYLMADFSLTNGDNASYQYYYKLSGMGIRYAGFEEGYNIISSFFAGIGVDYLLFRYIIIAFFVFLMFILAKRMSNNYSMFIFLYMLYPIFRDAEQIRFFFSSVLIYIGIFCFASLERGRSIILCFWVLLASQFHISAIFFGALLIFILPKKYHKRLLGLLEVLSVIIMLISLVGKDYLVAFLRLVDESRGAFYSSKTGHLGFLVPTLIFILYAFLFNYIIGKVIETGNCTISRICEKRKFNMFSKTIIFSKECVVENIERLLQITRFLNVLAIYSVPLLVINTHFYRIGRAIFVFDEMILPVIWDKLPKKERILVWGAVLVINLLFAFFDFFMTGSIQKQFMTLFM